MTLARNLRNVTRNFFVIVNLAFAVAFIIGCYGGRINSFYWWPTGFFALASFFTFLILVFFLIFWLLSSPLYTLVSIAAIAVCWIPVREVFRLQLASNFVMLKNPATLRVMDWNVETFNLINRKHSQHGREEMFALINTYQPDVACFQEAALSDSNAKAINYLPSVLQAIHFPYYHFSYNRKLNFDKQHHFGIITLSKYPIVNRHTLSYEPNDYNSIFQYVDIVKGTDTIRVFNVHLQSLRFTSEEKKYANNPNRENLYEGLNIVSKIKNGLLKRYIQSNRIRRAIDQSPYPVVVCGDFNDVPNSYAYYHIGKGLYNAFTEKGAGIGRTYYAIAPTLRIDNIFCDKRFSVEQFVRVKQKVSDHFPIVADLFHENPQ